ncbi:hypothetical protein [Burkholderia pseudomallei]|uniref:hypothetical protein n=1 Tax=Burkholderia pseudomallei TaxID=28450 RepID=UPI00015F7D7D|nr:hypothetical protein [Burkholderia pseudomallei]AJX61376.1 hypothetical protein DP47_3423 [Burkholderia pseudomallei Pasteur 52237]EDO95610.1 hypothetical protein BURPSPAST_C1395 [Burkholderia pseudomallei Pasteur 52237]MWA16538.1 hypothetical protein [Burkholderia pseudomallei]VBQ81246.1 Uncharacterised protein [Burkholderia pseudomallei]
MSTRKITNLRKRAVANRYATTTIDGRKVQATRGIDGKIRFRLDGRRISAPDLHAFVS